MYQLTQPFANQFLLIAGIAAVSILMGLAIGFSEHATRLRNLCAVMIWSVAISATCMCIYMQRYVNTPALQAKVLSVHVATNTGTAVARLQVQDNVFFLVLPEGEPIKKTIKVYRTQRFFLSFR